MQRIKKHWKLIFFLVIVIGGGLFWFFSRKEPTVEFIVEAASRAPFVQSVDARGELEAIDEVDLSFDISGTIKDVFVEVGDVVSSDELLAILNAEELEANVENARQALQAAQATLAQKYAGSTSQAIDVAKAAVSVAEAGLEAAQVELQNAEEDLEHVRELNENAVEEARIAMNAAEDSLENVLAENIQEEDELYEDLILILKSNVISVRSGLSDADEVLGITNTLSNNDFQDILSALDFQALVAAEDAYRKAIKSRDLAEDAVYSLSSQSTQAEIESSANLVETALINTENTLLQTRRTLDATVADTADFTLDDLSVLKTSIDSARTLVQSEHDSLLNALQSIASAQIVNAAEETSARNSLTSATQAYKSALANQTSQNAAAEAAVRSAKVNVSVHEADLAKAKASLAEVEAGPRSVDVAADQAQVKRAQADLDAALARLDRAQIRSPLDGIVTDISLEEGEQVFEGSAVITVQSTEDKFQIVVDVPEADIAKVEINDPAELTFDAFGDDDRFHARVAKIDPAEKVVEGVVFYEVTLFLEDDVIPAMKSGMTADVTILTEQLQDVITVPQRAVLRRGTESYVRIPVSETEFEERVVKIGLRGDGGRVQILSGLEEGEEVIISVREP